MLYTIVHPPFNYRNLHSPLWCCSLYSSTQESSTKKNTSQDLVIVAISIMYPSATGHLILSFYSNFVAIFNQDGAESDGLNTDLNNFWDPKSYSQVALEMVNYIIGDSVVVWRTWVIGGKNPYIVIFPAICTLGGLVSGIGLARSHATIPRGVAIYNTDMVIWYETFGAFTCAINIYAVAVISYKTWCGSTRTNFCYSSVHD
ncbi:hypothetical protein QCA50_018951 [Cerrena zonata]|uniref:Uncharacterized protein n=1 Tax=Cerrena zonata TaxID=2478898 RepID=A0AAW0FBW6_9APHY